MKLADILAAIDALKRAASAINLSQPISSKSAPDRFYPLIEECSNLAIRLQHELERELPDVRIEP